MKAFGHLNQRLLIFKMLVFCFCLCSYQQAILQFVVAGVVTCIHIREPSRWSKNAK